MTILQVRFIGPDHVQMTNVVKRLNVNSKNFQQTYFTIHFTYSLRQFVQVFLYVAIDLIKAQDSSKVL